MGKGIGSLGKKLFSSSGGGGGMAGGMEAGRYGGHAYDGSSRRR